MFFRSTASLFLAIAVSQTPALALDKPDYSQLVKDLKIDNRSEKRLTEACKLISGNSFDKGLKVLSTMAESGDPKAQYILGRIYKKGLPGVKADLEVALKWMTKASDQGFAPAQGILAGFYWTDKKHKDPLKALELAKSSAEKGDAKGQCALALIYMTGFKDPSSGKTIIPVNNTESIAWFTKSADQGIAVSQGMAAIQYYYVVKPPNYEKAIKYAKAGALGDDPTAMMVLADAYKNGNCIEKNVAKAVELLKKTISIDDHNIAAREKLAQICYSADPPVRDYQLAFKYASEASERGSLDALNLLGTMYSSGKGVARDPKKAFQFYEKAASQNNSRALNNLAFCYLDGIGVEKNTEKGLSILRQLAETRPAEDDGTYDAPNVESPFSRPDLLGAYNLGIIYRDGKYVPEDYKESFKWMKKASDLGNSDATGVIATYYLKGLGVERDFSQAIKFLTRASENGVPFAQHNLYIAYSNGLGVEKDDLKARYWLEKACEQNFAKSLRILGELYMRGPDENPDKAFECFSRAVKAGDPFSKNDLAICYIKGIGVKKDPERGIKILEKLVEKPFVPSEKPSNAMISTLEGPELKPLRIDDYRPDAIAAFNLGVLYRHGRFVPQDFGKAVRYFERAAKAGHTLAIANLASLYISGKGVEEDLVKGFEYNKIAAERGVPFSQWNLYEIYKVGQGVEADENEAYKWLEKAAENGYSRAQRELGEAYLVGRHYATDHRKAFNYFSQAATSGDKFAQCNLAACYLRGYGVDVSQGKAFKLFKEIVASPYKPSENRKSANLLLRLETGPVKVHVDDYTADAVASFNLAMMYRDGEGVERNNARLVEYLERACLSGHSLAEAILGSYCIAGSNGVELDLPKGVRLTEKAAKNGVNFAQYNLGLLYQRGRGVEKDMDAALLWIKKAADNGYSKAQGVLREMEVDSTNSIPTEETPASSPKTTPASNRKEPGLPDSM